MELIYGENRHHSLKMKSVRDLAMRLRRGNKVSPSHSVFGDMHVKDRYLHKTGSELQTGTVSAMALDQDPPLLRPAWSLLTLHKRATLHSAPPVLESLPSNTPVSATSEDGDFADRLPDICENNFGDITDAPVDSQGDNNDRMKSVKYESALNTPVDGALDVYDRERAEQEAKEVAEAVEAVQLELEWFERSKEMLARQLCTADVLPVYIPEHLATKTEKMKYLDRMIQALKYQRTTLKLKKCRAQRIIDDFKRQDLEAIERRIQELEEAIDWIKFGIKTKQEQIIDEYIDVMVQKSDSDIASRARSYNEINKSLSDFYMGRDKPKPKKRKQKKSQIELKIEALIERDKDLGVKYSDYKRNIQVFEEVKRRVKHGFQERELMGVDIPFYCTTLKEKTKYLSHRIKSYKKKKEKVWKVRGKLQRYIMELQRKHKKELKKAKKEAERKEKKERKHVPVVPSGLMTFKQKVLSFHLIKSD